MITVRRWDWDRQVFVEDAYPESLFKPFLDWLLTTQQWVDHPDLVVTKVNLLRLEMLRLRTPPDTHHQEVETISADEPNPVDREAEIQAKRLQSLAKARAARKAKRELAHA